MKEPTVAAVAHCPWCTAEFAPEQAREFWIHVHAAHELSRDEALFRLAAEVAGLSERLARLERLLPASERDGGARARRVRAPWLVEKRSARSRQLESESRPESWF
jgi:hypothetical protein